MLDEAPKQAGLKDPVVSGDLQFTVNSIKCGITKVGPGFLEEKPQGQFCRVTSPSRTSATRRPRSSVTSRSWSTTRTASSPTTRVQRSRPNSDNNDLWIGNINPGNTIKGNIVSDIPKGAEPVKMLLLAELFGDPVEVQLK